MRALEGSGGVLLRVSQEGEGERGGGGEEQREGIMIVVNSVSLFFFYFGPRLWVFCLLFCWRGQGQEFSLSLSLYFFVIPRRIIIPSVHFFRSFSFFLL